jgi:polyhydroxyalkanoate synthesis regulator phasin
MLDTRTKEEMDEKAEAFRSNLLQGFSKEAQLVMEKKPVHIDLDGFQVLALYEMLHEAREEIQKLKEEIQELEDDIVLHAVCCHRA